MGQTRSSYRRDHLLQTPDTFVRAPFPGMAGATAIVHASPAMGARFAEYTVELEKGGSFQTGAFRARPTQAFLYVIVGEIAAGPAGQVLQEAEFLYLPADHTSLVSARSTSRIIVIEKPFSPLNSRAPTLFAGKERDVPAAALGGDETIAVRELIPDDFVFDFAVNSMTFAPGAQLPMVEIHVMEHGLLMLEGEGVYRLGDHWYKVMAGDFIWMAPSCPQWFGALGRTPAKYLIYKDWNRHPLEI